MTDQVPTTFTPIVVSSPSGAKRMDGLANETEPAVEVPEPEKKAARHRKSKPTIYDLSIDLKSEILAAESVTKMADDEFHKIGEFTVDEDGKFIDEKRLAFLYTLINNNIYSLFMFALAVLTVIGDDFVNLVFDASSDLPYAWVLLFCLVVYAFDFVARTLVYRKQYVFSIYCIMDALSIAVLVPSVLLVFGVTPSSNTSSLAVARFSRIAKAAARIVRSIRLISNVTRGAQVHSEFEDLAVASRAGKQLNAKLLRDVVVGIISIFFLQLLTDYTRTFKDKTSGQAGDLAVLFATRVPVSLSLMTEFFGDRLLRYCVGGTCFLDRDQSTLRTADVLSYTSGPVSLAVSIRDASTLNSIIEILHAIILFALISVGLYFFQKEAETIFVQPVEKMLNSLRRLEADPMLGVEAKALGSQNETNVLVLSWKKLMFSVAEQTSNAIQLSRTLQASAEVVLSVVEFIADLDLDGANKVINQPPDDTPVPEEMLVSLRRIIQILDDYKKYLPDTIFRMYFQGEEEEQDNEEEQELWKPKMGPPPPLRIADMSPTLGEAELASVPVLTTTPAPSTAAGLLKPRSAAFPESMSQSPSGSGPAFKPNIRRQVSVDAGSPAALPQSAETREPYKVRTITAVLCTVHNYLNDLTAELEKVKRPNGEAPPEILGMMNDVGESFAHFACQEVKKFRGHIIDFSPHHVFAVWNAVQPMAQHMTYAANFALSMNNWRLPSDAGKVIRCVIHSEKQLCGDFGTSYRKFEVVGCMRIQLHLLQELNNIVKAKILITQKCYNDLKSFFEARPVDVIALPFVDSKAQPTTQIVYELIQEAKRALEEWMYQLHETDQKLQGYQRGFELFQKCKWKEAAIAFEGEKEDNNIQRLIAICDYMNANSKKHKKLIQNESTYFRKLNVTWPTFPPEL